VGIVHIMAPVGEVLGGRYRLERLLGAGGMGEVFAARDLLLDRGVAVKLPSAATAVAAARFQREARAAARINHPNVVAIYDWGETADGTPFIVMELVEGRSLRGMLQSRSVLPAREVIDLGTQIADALVAAHAHGVVHRDVKPSNIIVTPSGVVKVTDFGISLSPHAVDFESLTDPGTVLGTPGYLAPEQAAGLACDARADVYAVGVVLGELLAGTRDATLEAAADGGLAAVIARAKEQDPAQRYQRAADLRDALRAAARSLDAPVTANVVTATLAPEPTRAATPPPTPPKAPVVVVPAPAVVAPAPAPAAVASASPAIARAAPRTKREHKREMRAARRALHLRAKSERRWRAKHIAAIVAAPLALVAGGAFAYAQLTRPASARVPGVVDSDLFTAAHALQKAGFEVDPVVAHDPRPAGIVFAQSPRRGTSLNEGSHVTITISDVTATVPDVVGVSVDDALAELRKQGLVNVTLHNDYRDDYEPGTVVGSTPPAFAEATKANNVVVVVARDPHVTIPSVVGVDANAAKSKLGDLGLTVAVKTVSSNTVASGLVVSVSPSPDRVVVRGSTVTLTVSTGPRLFSVPYVVGESADNAMSDLDDAGFSVVVATTPVSNGHVGDVVAQDPPGGRAAEGSTVTITVGTRQARGRG
jgi:serine/threonine-protein kinase